MKPSILQANLTELKSFGSPPSAVLMVTGAVMVLMLGKDGKVPRDRYGYHYQVIHAFYLQILDLGPK